MPNSSQSKVADSERLKQINLELGGLKHKHNTCRLNTRFFGALAAVLITGSTLGVLHLALADDTDWAQNPDSPVYQLASQRQSSTWIPITLVSLGFVAGFLMLYKARHNCASQKGLWSHESELRSEMQDIRDKLYIKEAVQSPKPHHAQHPPTHKQPLTPEQAREEYIGSYSPPEKPSKPNLKTEQLSVQAKTSDG